MTRKKPLFTEAELALFRKAGAMGGKARAEKLTAEELSEQGRRAAKASAKVRKAKAKERKVKGSK